MSVAMKPSGIEWIGDIPEYWKVQALKRLLDEPLKYGANESAELEDTNFPRYIRITDFGNDGLLKTNTFKSLEPHVAEPYMLSEGDILFARSGATVGKTFQFKNYDGKACFAGYLIRANPKNYLMTSDFLYYFTKSPAYDGWKESIFTQATIQNIGADKYAYLPVCVPPVMIQNTITSFLDKSTSQIDNAIKTKQAQLATLETLKKSIIHKAVTKSLNDSVAMKDSGIEWIGEIPEHWKIVRVKDDLEFFTGKTPDTTNGEYYIGSNKWITIRDLGDLYITDTKQYISDNYITESKIQIAPKGSLLFSFKLTVGTVAIIDVPMYTNEAIAIFPPNIKINTKFLYYSFGLYLKENAKTNIYGAALMNRDIIKASKYLMPLKEEQQLIVDFLDKEVEKINTLKENVQNQINKLKEYKKSLIYEYVTGKKQVKE